MLLSSRTSLGILSLIYFYQKLWKLPICCSCQEMQINMDLEARRYEREIICHISPVHWTLDFLLVCLGNEFLRCSQLDANVWHVILRLMSGHSHVPRDAWHVTRDLGVRLARVWTPNERSGGAQGGGGVDWTPHYQGSSILTLIMDTVREEYIKVLKMPTGIRTFWIYF